MKTQILKILCAALFFIIFGYFFGDEYWEYHQQGEQEREYRTHVGNEVSDFNPDALTEFGKDTQLHYTPDLGLLDQIIEEIDAAKEKIYVEVYIFTETQMRDAIIRANERGVEVKILLENNPYKAPYLNDKHYNAFKDAGVDVRWSDPLNYSLNHSKLLIIDDRAYVSTGNFSYSLFKYNRDFLLSFTQEEFVNVLQQLFIGDFEHENLGIYHDKLVLSPDYSRFKLTKLIQSANKSIDFYFPYMQDDDFRDALFSSANKGIDIRGVVEKNFYNENDDIIEEFLKNNIALQPLNGDKLHAKALLIDEKHLYVGSVNFSTYSFDENREIGVIIEDQEIIQKFTELFESDF